MILGVLAYLHKGITVWSDIGNKFDYIVRCFTLTSGRSVVMG